MEGEGAPPSGGLLFLEKGRGRGMVRSSLEAEMLPPHLHPQRRMTASSHLLGAGVSDNLGVPSVSLLSEDAVASESVRGEGWSVAGPFQSTSERCHVISMEGAGESDSPAGHIHTILGGSQPLQLPEMSLTTDFLPGLHHNKFVKHLTVSQALKRGPWVMATPCLHNCPRRKMRASRPYSR